MWPQSPPTIVRCPNRVPIIDCTNRFSCDTPTPDPNRYNCMHDGRPYEMTNPDTLAKLAHLRQFSVIRPKSWPECHWISVALRWTADADRWRYRWRPPTPDCNIHDCQQVNPMVNYTLKHSIVWFLLRVDQTHVFHNVSCRLHRIPTQIYKTYAYFVRCSRFIRLNSSFGIQCSLGVETVRLFLRK